MVSESRLKLRTLLQQEKRYHQERRAQLNLELQAEVTRHCQRLSELETLLMHQTELEEPGMDDEYWLNNKPTTNLFATSVRSKLNCDQKAVIKARVKKWHKGMKKDKK